MSIAARLITAFKTHAPQIALTYDNNELTYNELQLKCFKVAASLHQKGFTNKCIAIEVDNLTDHIIAMLGIVISGNWYVSVTAENKAFLTDSNLPVALTVVAEHAADTEITLDELLMPLQKIAASEFADRVSNETEMCAFFTSGSTGRSKIVVHQHKNTLNDTLRQIADNGITGFDRLDLVFSLSFSASLACIYPALLTGARLCLFDLKTGGLHKLAAFWQQQGVTFSTLSVTAFQGVCKLKPTPEQLSSLRFVSISAEPIKDTTIQLFKSTFSRDTTLQIAYATTETRTISEMKVRNDGSIILYPDAIGKPVMDKTVHIAGPDGEYLPVGATGEIVVASSFIANSYYGDLHTESPFSFNSDTIVYRTGDLGYLNKDGYLFYQGRLKNEQKFNGTKINLLDIEQVIEKITDILQAAVVINKSNPDQPKLVCFFTADNGVSIKGSDIRQAISEALPLSHLPQFFIGLPELPLTHSGKIDRKKLEVFDLKTYLEPLDTLQITQADDDYEAVIIDVFKDVLQINSVNANTDFFDAGGDSMGTLLCVAGIEAVINVAVNTTALVANPTPKKLSAYLKQTAVRLIFETQLLNESSDGKTDLYFLDHAKNNRYRKFVNSALSTNFNLIEIIYDIYAPPKEIINQLAQLMSGKKQCIVVGHSFHGYVAHQLACLVPQITHCILIDTYDYFDYGKYVQPETVSSSFQRHFWHFFLNRDFKYPIHRLILKYNKYKRRNRVVDPERQRLSALHNNRINFFLDEITHKTTINHCIYFQGSRTHQNCSKTWQAKVGGKFYYYSMVCTHSNIVRKKAEQMADIIVSITSAGR